MSFFHYSQQGQEKYPFTNHICGCLFNRCLGKNFPHRSLFTKAEQTRDNNATVKQQSNGTINYVYTTAITKIYFGSSSSLLSFFRPQSGSRGEPLFLLGEVDSCYSHFLLLSSFQHRSSHCGKKNRIFGPTHTCSSGHRSISVGYYYYLFIYYWAQMKQKTFLEF